MDCFKKLYGPIVLAACVLLAAAPLAAQKEIIPRTEVYGGYNWADPGGKFGSTNVGGMEKGFAISSTYNFTRYFGFSIDTSANFKKGSANLGSIAFGPVLHARNGSVEPFVHALFGLQRIQPSNTLPGGGRADWGGTGLLGGGVDVPINKWFAWRSQADYMLGKHNYPLSVSPTQTWSGGRVGSGIVVRFGAQNAVAAEVPAAACSAQPPEVLAGEPVTVTANASGFKKDSTLAYSWTASGGKTSGNAASTQVDTTGLAPGQYSVKANITGNKKNQTATCTANFTVKEKPAPPPENPPTISCSANPATVRAGEPSTITCNAASPDNRPVTTAFQGGKLTPSGNNATLDTAGAQPGPITVTATATDDRGKTASTTTTVTVEAPPPPPQASKANQINFKDKRRPARVDNEAKAILDDIALRLQREADSKAVVVGNAAGNARNKTQLSAQRAINTKDYLTREKGIDPSRISVMTGGENEDKADIYIVPAGATFNEPNTQPVDEKKMKAQPRGGAHAGARSGAAKAKPAAKPAQ
jgi:outer membrane protein OmpA-like peptidoglycan-associated protein